MKKFALLTSTAKLCLPTQASLSPPPFNPFNRDHPFSDSNHARNDDLICSNNFDCEDPLLEGCCELETDGDGNTQGICMNYDLYPEKCTSTGNRPIGSKCLRNK